MDIHIAGFQSQDAFDYLLSTGESYGQTAQHMQDFQSSLYSWTIYIIIKISCWHLM